MLWTDEINLLRERRSRLKNQGRFLDALPLQLQIHDFVKANGNTEELSSSLNYLSMLYHEVGCQSDAEVAAREALATYQTVEEPSDEIVATYEMMLAYILAAQKRFSEAVAVGNSALEHYSVFHNPLDDFLASRQRDVDVMIKHRDRESKNAE